MYILYDVENNVGIQTTSLETGLNEAVLNRDYSTIREILSKSY